MFQKVGFFVLFLGGIFAGLSEPEPPFLAGAGAGAVYLVRLRLRLLLLLLLLLTGL